MERRDIENSSLLNQRGFTLIELLVVMMIISMLAAFVGPRVFKKLEKAKYQAAEGQIHLFEMAIDSYRLDVGDFPRSLNDLISNPGVDGWDGPYLKKGKIPKDPWGGEYDYRVEADNYTISASRQREEQGGAEPGDVVNPG